MLEENNKAGTTVTFRTMFGLKNLLKTWKTDKQDKLEPKIQLWNPPHEARRQISWIEDCAKNHKWCNRFHTQNDFLPTRLIDLQKYPDLSLITTQNLKGEDKRYTALSYCWGTPSREQVVTTRLRLRSHQQAIFLQRLPKTLRDAIEVTKSFGVPYIWIDVLCVIQDDEEDFRRERDRIGKVFLHSFVTISNAVSENSDEGFLHDPWLASLPSVDEPGGHGSEPQGYSDEQEYSGKHSSEQQECSEKQGYFEQDSCCASQECFEKQEYSEKDEYTEKEEYSEKNSCCEKQECWGSKETLNEKQLLENSVEKQEASKILTGRKSDQKPRNQDWVASLFRSPNFKRRWLWQERELPPRVLHFMPNNVVFECRGERLRYEIPGSYRFVASMPPELRETDEVGDSWPYRLFDVDASANYRDWPWSSFKPGIKASILADNDQSTTDDGLNRSQCVGHWHDVIERYSTRHLDDMTENLQALAEVADQFGHVLGWEYTVGIWSVTCLLWQRQDVTPTELESIRQVHALAALKPPRSKNDYVAPSWTWASVSFPVQFKNSEISRFGKSIAEDIKYTPHYGTFGRNKKLIRGALCFRAPLKTLQSVAPSKSHKDPLRQFYKIKINVGKMDDEMMIAWDTEEAMNSNDEVQICVLLFEEKKEVKIGAGLALRPTSRVEWKRVGMASYISEEWKKDAEMVAITIV